MEIEAKKLFEVLGRDRFESVLLRDRVFELESKLAEKIKENEELREEQTPDEDNEE